MNFADVEIIAGNIATGEAAEAVAILGWFEMSAISPNTSPLPRVATSLPDEVFSPPRAMSTVPETTQ